MFTSEHYEVLASLLGESEDLTMFQEKLMLYLETENPNFNPVRFIKIKLGLPLTRSRTRNEVLYPSFPQGYVTKY